MSEAVIDELECAAKPDLRFADDAFSNEQVIGVIDSLRLKVRSDDKLLVKLLKRAS